MLKLTLLLALLLNSTTGLTSLDTNVAALDAGYEATSLSHFDKAEDEELADFIPPSRSLSTTKLYSLKPYHSNSAVVALQASRNQAIRAPPLLA